ncbi:ectoine synthase [Neobacillus niacini]|uniref:ectoine synthase n=1 Tax=Neobacillus niacini TaxID=86668 RepID=UPI003001BC90
MEVQIKRLDQDGHDFDIGEGCRAQALVWPGMGSIYRSMNYLEVSESNKTREFIHNDSEATYFIAQGTGKVIDVDSGEMFEVKKGKMILLDSGTRYVFEANGGEKLICIGGPCPPDSALYKKNKLSNKGE